jgi:alginate O-acetyltransferase complex protein AlgI
MWAVALSLGIALKWLTWRDALALGVCPSPQRAFLWFAVWPGMDGRAFLDETKRPGHPAFTEWLWAAAAIILGALLIWLLTPLLVGSHGWAAAWAGMVGVVLLLHFGFIRVLSLLCRAGGIEALPIMNSPAGAASLADFWGARWNTGFSIPARRLILPPIARRYDIGTAGLLVFLISGLLHELVISLPARGGYGLPTLYFLLQWVGLTCERSQAGRQLGFGAGFAGWLFTMSVVLVPLPWLFHPPFVNRVVLPFLDFLNHL